MNKDNFILYEWNNETKEFWFLGEKIDYIHNPTEWKKYLNNLVNENKQLKEKIDTEYHELASEITRLQQENQQLKDVNSLSKRELYKINRDRLDANLKLLKENEKLKLRIDTNTSILAIINSKLEEENKELKEKLKMKEILCFNMPKGVDIICLTKADYERNKYEYETYENLEEISEIYQIQRNRWKKHSHKLAMKCDRFRIQYDEIERYIKEHLTDNGRFLMLNEWQVQELLQKINDGRKWINGRN